MFHLRALKCSLNQVDGTCSQQALQLLLGQWESRLNATHGQQVRRLWY